ncbi:hypothetical protein C8F04DRAFT_1233390 [Mycena alexandri]|uniref:Uncharacterized protein n=1 Tax=Mycena alexandri TaxID=1745969 RepID=A0AAD6T1X4_9AGAR|nr:hypothetical protein C8F04DRAFT_1233390 [Mycena alexandri]
MSESSHGSRASGRARFRRTFRSRGIAVVNRGNRSRISVVSIVSVRAQRELALAALELETVPLDSHAVHSAKPNPLFGLIAAFPHHFGIILPPAATFRLPIPARSNFAHSVAIIGFTSVLSFLTGNSSLSIRVISIDTSHFNYPSTRSASIIFQLLQSIIWKS